MQFLAYGESADQIAARLVISAHTVQTHVRNVLAKLEVHSKLEAVALAARSGAVTV
ncbi:MAG: response regulator transcription factor [Mycobacteriales bacterium]